MSKFNNKGKAEMPELNTSSLPDLIFSILFFFMIVTSMREEEVKVEYTLNNMLDSWVLVHVFS